MRKYTNQQLAYALDYAIKKHKEDMAKPIYPENKIQWIKKTAIKIIDLLESETQTYNKINISDPLKSNDIVSVLSTALNCVLKSLGIKLKRD